MNVEIVFVAIIAIVACMFLKVTGTIFKMVLAIAAIVILINYVAPYVSSM